MRDPERDGLKVLITLETDAATAGRTVTLGFVLADDRGVVVTSGGGPTDTGRYLVPVGLSPGRYLLKAAGVEPGGRQGSVERRFVAELTASRRNPGERFHPGRTIRRAHPVDSFVPAADRLVAYLEVYGPAGWTPPEGLATIVITTPDGSDPLISVPASTGAAGPGRWIVRAEVPLNDLPPGPYVASARLAIGGLSTRPPHASVRGGGKIESGSGLEAQGSSKHLRANNQRSCLSLEPRALSPIPSP